MILGMTPLVLIHTLISLVAIVAGFVILKGLFDSKRLDGWTQVFLGTIFLTSASGFILPADKFLPSHATGIVAILVVLVAYYARYSARMTGRWRAIYAGTAVASLYFDVFVLVVQFFTKIPALRAMAPTQSEPPFAIAQGIVLVIFLYLGFVAVRRFHPPG